MYASDVTHNDERSNYPDTIAEIYDFIRDSNETLATVIGIDANATLLPYIPNITGKFTLPPLPTHNQLSRNRILNLIGPLKLKAPQTYA